MSFASRRACSDVYVSVRVKGCVGDEGEAICKEERGGTNTRHVVSAWCIRAGHTTLPEPISADDHVEV